MLENGQIYNRGKYFNDFKTKQSNFKLHLKKFFLFYLSLCLYFQYSANVETSLILNQNEPNSIVQQLPKQPFQRPYFCSNSEHCNRNASARLLSEVYLFHTFSHIVLRKNWSWENTVQKFSLAQPSRYVSHYTMFFKYYNIVSVCVIFLLRSYYFCPLFYNLADVFQ